MKKENYQIINDAMFKLIFRDKRIAVDYINSFLNLSLCEDDVVECNPIIKHSINGKGSEFDVRVIIKGTNKGIDIEAQRINPSDYKMDKRLIKYATKQYVDLLKVGDEYNKDVESFALSFCDYKLENNELYDEITLYSHTYKKKYRDIQIKIISLKEAEKYDNIKLRKRLEILTTKDFKKYEQEEGVLGVMAKKMIELNEEEQVRIMAESAEISIINYNCALAAEKKAGFKQGIEQGIEQRSIEIAKSMLDKNMDISLISELTGLSREEINK